MCGVQWSQTLNRKFKIIAVSTQSHDPNGDEAGNQQTQKMSRHSRNSFSNQPSHIVQVFTHRVQNRSRVKDVRPVPHELPKQNHSLFSLSEVPKVSIRWFRWVSAFISQPAKAGGVGVRRSGFCTPASSRTCKFCRDESFVSALFMSVWKVWVELRVLRAWIRKCCSKLTC